MNNLDFFINRFHPDINQPSPIFIDGGRIELIQLFKDLNFKVGVEIGVQRGDFSEYMCKTIPDLELYAVDAWTHYEGYHDVRASRKGQVGYDEYYEMAKNRLAPYNATLVRKWSTEAYKDFPDEYFDFVYIDGNHEFEHVTEDIANWSKKVKKGGIISGHDYARVHGWTTKVHVLDVVNGWTASHYIKPFFVFNKYGSPNWLWFNQ